MFNLDFSVHGFKVVTIDLHYMTDRQERFDLKILSLYDPHRDLISPS